METRRLQLVGGGTSYSVSLPKQWVEAKGLHPGDEVLIESPPTGELRIRAQTSGAGPRHERALTIKSNDPDEILRRLIALYVSGFDTATVAYGGSNPLAVQTAVGEACARLHGLQIVEETPGRVVLQDLSGTRDFNMEKGLRRMQLLVLQMLTNIGRLVEGGGETVLSETNRYESELDRILLLLLKQYSVCLKRGEFPPSAIESGPGGLHAILAAHYLERIGDYAMRLCSYSHFLSQEPAAPVNDVIRASVADLRVIVGDANKAFNDCDATLANDVVRKALTFAPATGRDSMFDVFTSPRSQPQLYSCVRCIKFFTLLESIERIALYAKSIAETAINRSLIGKDATPT
ncbi:MAG: hypothetical protein HY556_03835 [Euryarchaeota archaeon]|nr:hypothetical protein [Euryarchaeota archaeon]